jgi:hypothetical protein
MYVVYAILALVIFAGLSQVLSGANSSTAQGVLATRVSTDLRSQAATIQQRILLCRTRYPNIPWGTGSLPAAPTYADLPANPTGNDARLLICPGQPNTPNLWGGVEGVAYPSVPNGFGNWQYFNQDVASSADDGAFVRISTTGNFGRDPTVQNAMRQSAERFDSRAANAACNDVAMARYEYASGTGIATFTLFFARPNLPIPGGC